MDVGNKGATGQVRRIHIIYFLSRGGKNEDPHLIRVRHGNGVYLRDVKRWLSNLRGKDMPETYAWSYKRRYKHGYVWQDLLDDDLITPISDSEYVLKGSYIIIPTIPYEPKKTTTDSCNISKENPPLTKEDKQEVYPSESSINTKPTKTSSENNEKSTASSTVTEDSLEQEEKISNTDRNGSKDAKDHSSFYASLLNKKNRMESILFSRNTEKNNGNQNSSTSSSSSSSASEPSFLRSKSYTNGASQAIFNWLPCRSTGTKDSALLSISSSANKKKSSGKAISKPEIPKGEKIGASAKIFSTCLDYNQLHLLEHSRRKSCDGFKTGTRESAAFEPLSEPNCKQCGKPVKPESWIKHVQTCKETKALLKKAAATFEEEPSRKSFSHC